MKKDTLIIREQIVRYASMAAIVIIALLFLFISVESILHTSVIDVNNPYAEIVTQEDDNLLTNIALIGLSSLGLLLLVRKNVSLSKVDTRFILFIMLIITSVISLSWVNLTRSAASGETQTVLNTAKEAAEGLYGNFTTPYSGAFSYYQFYPFQLGYVFFAEILYRLFGTASTEILFQIINVIALDFLYVGVVMVTQKIFDSRNVTNMTALALMLCFQPMFFTILTYGVLIGVCLAVWSVFFVIRYFRNNKLLDAGLAVLLITLAVLIKYSMLVVLAAICIAVILHVTEKKQWLALAMAALMILTSLGLPKLVEIGYASASGATLGTRVTPTLYEYMGVDENEGSERPAGWFSFIALNTLVENELDMQKADEAAREGIRERRTQLAETNRLVSFYKEKLLSQINEPSFQSVWISQVRNHNLPEGDDLSPVVTSVYTGGLHKLLDIWFNYYNMIIFCGFVAGMVWMILKKKHHFGALILPMAAFGGIVYHTVCEAKSQFMLPYFILLIPFAMYGLACSFKALNKKVDFLYK